MATFQDTMSQAIVAIIGVLLSNMQPEMQMTNTTINVAHIVNTVTSIPTNSPLSTVQSVTRVRNATTNTNSVDQHILGVLNQR